MYVYIAAEGVFRVSHNAPVMFGTEKSVSLFYQIVCLAHKDLFSEPQTDVQCTYARC